MTKGSRVVAAAGLLTGVAASFFLFAGCEDVDGGDPDQQAAEPPDGSLRGELAVYVSTAPAAESEAGGVGPSALTFFLRARPGTAAAAEPERKLLFDHDPGLASGEDLKVWGVETPDGLRVTSFQVVPKTVGSTVTSPLIAGTPYAPRSFAFVLIDVGGGVNTTDVSVMGRLINDANSIRNYYLEDSYGRQDITAQVFTGINYTMTDCGTSKLATDLRPMIQGTFQHYLWYLGSKVAACQWSGLASLGSPDRPQRDTWYNASTSCVVLVQEPGHNFGMQHSSSLRCTGASFADTPDGACTADEYGDPFDPMGRGCKHMNAFQKSYQGWLGGCNGVKVTSSASFTLLPFENRCDGVQFLQIKMPKTRTFMRPADGGGGATTETFAYYYVELRTPVGFDGTLGGGTTLSPRVLVHVGSEIPARNQRGLHTFLLDMTPTTATNTGFNDAALAAGATFNDPAGGLSITAEAVSATQATIRVDVTGGSGDPTCLDGTVLSAPGPGPESCGGPVGTGGAGGAGAPTGGTTGSGGRPGTGGRGTGGAGGGRGGAGGGGAGGGGGAAGSRGTGGAAGGNGGAGTGGAPGSGGQNVVTGTGGQGPRGTGGQTIPGGTGGQGIPGGTGGARVTPPHEDPHTIVGGCDCTIGAADPASVAGSAALLMALGAVIGRGRSRRAGTRRRR